jgi:hypothetical protein
MLPNQLILSVNDPPCIYQRIHTKLFGSNKTKLNKTKCWGRNKLTNVICYPLSAPVFFVMNLKEMLMTYLKQSIWIIFVTIIGTGAAVATEEAKYNVVFKDDIFEMRYYEPHMVAETIVDGDFEDAGSNAFKRLFKYITGNNTSQQDIAMTAPVTQGAEGENIDMTSPVGQQGDNGLWTVSFMMPASYSAQTLPQPKDPKVVLRQVPAQYMASIEYSGFWSEKNYISNKEKLDAWISANSFKVIGEPLWARYNDPFTLWFLRRNEILIPIENPPAKNE